MSWLSDLIGRGKDLLSQEAAPVATEAIRRNSFDRADWEKVLEVAPPVQVFQSMLERTVDYAADFMGDLHAGLFKVEPQVRPEGEMKPSHVANRAVMATLLDMPQMQALRQHSTGDKYHAAMAMIAMQTQAVEVLNKVHAAAQEEAQQQEKVQQEREKAQQAIEEMVKNLEENPPAQPLADGQEGPQPAPDARPGALSDQLDQFGSMAAPSSASVAQAARTAAEGASHAMRVAAKDATDKLDGEAQLMEAFGVDPGELQKMDVAQRIALAQKLSSKRMAEFAKLIGQFKMVQKGESRKRVVNAASEVFGVTTGDDLTRISASELLNFADPALEDLMWARFTEQQLVINDLRGKEKQGQGPIVCVVDESGTMSKRDVGGGSREAWSKALALALCDQAKRRKRDFIYIGFGSVNEQHVVQFLGGDAPIEKVISMTEHFFAGGTHFEKPLRMALDIIEEQAGHGKPKADVVFMTDDAYGSMDPTFMAGWNKAKDATSFKCYGIAIGTNVGRALGAVSDNVREITELVSNPRVVGDLFRTI